MDYSQDGGREKLLSNSSESASSDSDSGDVTSAKSFPNDYDSRNMQNLFASSETASHENIWSASPHETLDYTSAKVTTEDPVKNVHEGLSEMLDIDGQEQQDMQLQALSVATLFEGPDKHSTVIRTVKAEKFYPFQRAILVGPPPDFCLLAVLATFCCFMPTGIIAIIRSTESNGLYQSGLLQEARSTSEKARYWIRLSICIGMGIYIFCALVLCVLFFSHFTNQS